jgi:hypothetical protein
MPMYWSSIGWMRNLVNIFLQFAKKFLAILVSIQIGIFAASVQKVLVPIFDF